MIHISLEELTRHMGVRVSCVCGAEIPATASPCPGAQTPEGLGREGELSALGLECVRWRGGSGASAQAQGALRLVLEEWPGGDGG